MIHFAERIFIAAHTSMEGLAIERQLLRLGHPKSHILHAPSSDFSWSDPHQISGFLADAQPDQIYLPARPFLHKGDREDLNGLWVKAAVSNIISSAARAGIKKLLLLVGSEVYPSSRLPPFAEEDLIGGPIGGQWSYDALTQISAMKLCEQICSASAGHGALDYRCAVVGGIYGPGDDYSGRSMQPVPLILQMLERAKSQALPSVNIALQEDQMLDLLFVDDMAEAVVYLMEMPLAGLDEHRNSVHRHINVAHGEPVRAENLVRSFAHTLGYFGNIVFAKQDCSGIAIQKNLDPYRLAMLGWTPMMGIDQGIEIVSTDFQLHRNNRIKTP